MKLTLTALGLLLATLSLSWLVGRSAGPPPHVPFSYSHLPEHRRENEDRPS